MRRNMYWFEKLNGHHTVQVVYTYSLGRDDIKVHETAADLKLTHIDHDKLLPSQLSTLIASLLEQQCYKLSVV